VKVFENLLEIKKEKGAGYLVLIDPDKQSAQEAVDLALKCQDADVDALLVGGSLLFGPVFEEVVQAIKSECKLPIIIFPGSTRQISKKADAILFLSLLSSRNPNYIIGDQVIAAPILKSINLETISTAYLFIESGNITSAQYISDTRPMPRDKPDIAIAHALAAEYLGMKMVYLEAGSGAQMSVPESLISALTQYITMPIIVGGGIRTPDEARKKVNAGASFVVTGNVLEQNRDIGLLRDFSSAVHIKSKNND
jgi:phosphoglycerol geranylgeranyltransferase